MLRDDLQHPEEPVASVDTALSGGVSDGHQPESAPPALKASLRAQVETLAAEWSVAHTDLQDLKRHYHALCRSDADVAASQQALDVLCEQYTQSLSTALSSSDSDTTTCTAAATTTEEDVQARLAHNTARIHTHLDLLERLLARYASHTAMLSQCWTSSRAWQVAMIDRLFFLTSPYPLLRSLYKRRELLFPEDGTRRGHTVSQHGDTNQVAELERELAARSEDQGAERRRVQDAELARDQLAQQVAELQSKLDHSSVPSAEVLRRVETEKVALAQRLGALEEDMAVAAELSLQDTERIAGLEKQLSEAQCECEASARLVAELRARVASYDERAGALAQAEKEVVRREKMAVGEVGALREALMLKESVVTRLEIRMHRAAAVEEARLKRLRDVWAGVEGDLLELPPPPSSDEDASCPADEAEALGETEISPEVALMLKREVRHLLKQSTKAVTTNLFGV